MRQARALVPYAVVAALIVASSAAVLAFALQDSGAIKQAAPGPTPSATVPGTPRPLPELSKSGRLAYWRGDTSAGDSQLLVSNIDGTQRRPIARIDSVRRVVFTRWTPDGGAVSYLDTDLLLTVVGLDGSRTEIPFTNELRGAGYRIIDVRWSPAGDRVAATVQRPSDGRGDIYIASRAVPQWLRATALDDAYAADWLTSDELLAHTTSGVVGILRAGTLNALRPLTGLVATSPILGDDGRVHFLSGSIQPARDPAAPFLSASRAIVWSVTVDGGDLRRETSLEQDDVRLDAVWVWDKGRYLVHRGVNQLQSLMGESFVLLPIEAGLIERAILSPDRRIAIGFAGSRIIRLDIARGGTTLGSPSVLLDSVGGGDVWFPRSLTLARSLDPRPAAAPKARYAFLFGGNVWMTGSDGTTTLLRGGAFVGTSQRRGMPPPSWSPHGDRLLAVEPAGTLVTGVVPSPLIPVVMDRAGTILRFPELRPVGLAPSWSPDGAAFAAVVDKRGVDALSTQADLEVRFVAAREGGGAVRPPLLGREVVWRRVGIYLLTAESVDLVQGDERRAVFARARIQDDPRAQLPRDATLTLATLGVSADGAYLSVRATATSPTTSARAIFAVGRTGDGAVTFALQSDRVLDIAWSPSRAQVGHSDGPFNAQVAIVRDAATGEVIAHQDGRFAGWSPEGDWYYVGRAAGLFAYAIAGGGLVYVGPVGVPVSATLP